MSTTMTPNNGKVQRKQLADQLDRLDAILDLMAEGLPAAVTDAVREGTHRALKDALVELLTSAELRTLMTAGVNPTASAAPAPAPKASSFWSLIRSRIAAVRNTLARTAIGVKEVVATKYKAACNVVATVGAAAGEALPLRRVLWVGLGVGLAAGLVCLLVPHAAAAAVSAVSVAVTTVAVQMGTWLKKAAKQLSLA